MTHAANNGMERVCEPELMDEQEQARAYAEADFASSDQAVVEEILRRIAALPLKPRRLLDLGCGPGNLSFRLAEALPQLAIVGLDGAAAMLQPALHRLQTTPRRWPQLRFLQARLPLSPPGLADLPDGFRPPYDVLVSNSLLHHLHDPQVLWTGLQQQGAPGSLVVVRDLRRPSDPAALEALVKRYASDAPPVLQRDFRASLHAAFRADEVRAQLRDAALGTLEVNDVEDRYLEVTGLLP